MISRHFCALLKLHGPSNSSRFSSHSSISRRPLPLSSQFGKNVREKIDKSTEPLSVFYKRSFQVKGKSEKNSGVEAEDDSESAKLKVKLRDSKEEEASSLREKLRNLEEEVRILNKKMPEKEKKLKLIAEKVGSIGRKGAKRSLAALFAGRNTGEVKLGERTDFGNEDPTVYKELSPDMKMFAHHLYAQGYFKNASFLRGNKFDATCFEVSYAREFLKFAAVNFGKDHQEIVKWLSANDLKKVAIFGCPSLGQSSVYAAKHMRRFFEIDEQQVCQKCTLKTSCKHANKSFKNNSTELILANVTRVLTMYAMVSVPQKLSVPWEIKNSVSGLLKEIISLTQNTT